MLGITDGKFNNTQALLDEFHKTTLFPLCMNFSQHLEKHLLKGYPTLSIEFDTSYFLKGSPKEQMEYAVAGASNGIMTPNEARCHLGMPALDDESADELQVSKGGDTGMNGTSPQDTGGGGGPALGNTNTR